MRTDGPLFADDADDVVFLYQGNLGGTDCLADKNQAFLLGFRRFAAFDVHEQAADARGNILNIASSSSLRPAISAYTLTKWGLRGLTLGLAKVLAPYGITVNGLAPGPTATPMLNKDPNNITLNVNPMGRYAMPEEIANMAVVLCSGIGKMVVGDIVYMTGGAGLLTYDDVNYDLNF